MAKGRERENPRFDPTRIVQPTSAPVDLYFRPMLRGPEPSKLMQVAEALGGISPTLNRLASDAAAAGIAAEKNAGTFQEAQAAEEARKTGDQSAYERKRTEAIEKAGGLAPWRFTEYLKATGERGVEKYRSALYENLDDISNPYNPDGTLRPADYVAKRMQELYDQAGIPTDSYYITQGAMKARSEVDRSFYDRLMASRRQKVIQASEESLQDRLSSAIETSFDYSEVFGKSGKAKILLDEYYRTGGQNGNEILAKTAIAVARGHLSNGDYDKARDLMTYLLNEKIGERSLGNRYRPDLQQTLEFIETKERENEFEDANRRETRKKIAVTEVSDKVTADLVKMQASAPNGFLTLSPDERLSLVRKAMAGTSIAEEMKPIVEGLAADRARIQIEAMNQPSERDPRAASMSMEEGYRNALKMSKPELDDYLHGMMDKGLFTWPQAQQLRAINQGASSIPDTDRQRFAARLTMLRDGWTGLTESQIAVDGRSEVSAIGRQAEIEVIDAFYAEINSPKFKTDNPDEVSAHRARNQVMDRLVGEKMSELQTRYKSKVDQYNLASSFEATVGPNVKQEADAVVSSIMVGLGLGDDKGYQAAGLSRRLGALLYDRARDSWMSSTAAPGSPPMTLEQRKKQFYDALPDIVDRLYSEVQATPEKLGLPATYLNMLRSPTAQEGLDGLPEVAPAAASVSDIAAGLEDFKTAPQDTASEDRLVFGTRGGPVLTAPGGPENVAMFPAEPGLAASAKNAATLYAASKSDPSNRPKHDVAKEQMGQAAADVIEQMRTLPVSSYKSGNWPTALRAAVPRGGITPAEMKSTSLYEMKQDGVYHLIGGNGQRKLDPIMTKRYWVAKSIVGYTQKEISDLRTAEGVTISQIQLDPEQYLYFQSFSEFKTAIDEYTKSAGKSGVIAEKYLPASGFTFADFRQAQLGLLTQRKPGTK